MSRFHNPVPVDIDFSAMEQVEVKGTGVDLIDDLTPETPEVEEPTNPESEPITDIVPSEEIVPVEVEEEEDSYEDNIYLKTINNLVDKGIIVDSYPGFTDDTEPTQEVLEKFLEHNLELRDNKVIEDFVGNISPLTQRILEFDLNSKGQNLEFYLKTLIEENNIKGLKVDNEYDQEKIVRMWYTDEDYTPDEIEEKIQELKDTSLLAKEAGRLKPKLDVRAEAIAKEAEEAERMLKQIETRRKEDFFGRVESIIKTGKVDNMVIGKEDAEKIMALLVLDNVPVKLPEGKELKMNYLEAEIFKHKYSSKGDPKLLVQVAYLLSNPDKFYQQFANVAKTKETNEFVKSQKYNIQSKSAPVVEKTKSIKKETKQVPWNKSW